MDTLAEKLPAPSPNGASALTRMVQNDTVNNVMQHVARLQQGGSLKFPPNYSPENALMSAYLKIQHATTPDNKPVLTACTKESVANALLDMVIQGLSPTKDQCYFIPYGNQLLCQRSYFGTMAVTKRVTRAQEIFSEVVYEGDKFAYDVVRGNKQNLKHSQDADNIAPEKIKGAYCTIIGENGQEYSEYMTLAEIKTAWSMSKAKPLDDKGNVKPGSAHGKFPGEMAKKTVINRACKALINSSNDSSLDLVVERFNRTDDAIEEAEFHEEIEQNANREVLDLPAGDTQESTQGSAEPAEVKKADPPRELPQTKSGLKPGF
jgi:recombination protein RecT